MKAGLVFLATLIIGVVFLFQNCGTGTGDGFKSNSSLNNPDTSHNEELVVAIPITPIEDDTPEDDSDADPTPMSTATTKLGSPNNTQGLSIQPVDDNNDGTVDGYITTGLRVLQQNSLNVLQRDLFFSKFDAAGNHLFSQTIGAANVAEVGYRAIDLPDSYLVVATVTAPASEGGTRDIGFYKLNKSNGAIIMQKRLAHPWTDAIIDIAPVVVNGNTEIVATGWTAKDSGKEVGIFLRLSTNLEILASSHYQEADHNLRFRSLVARNSVFLAGDLVHQTNGSKRAFLVKVNYNGEVLRKVVAGDNNIQAFQSVRGPMELDSIVAVSSHVNSNSQGVLAEFDTNLQSTRTTIVGTQQGVETFTSLDVAPDGQIIISGNYGIDVDSEINSMVLRFSKDHSLLWAKNFGGNKDDGNAHHSIVFRLTQNKGNGVAMVMNQTTQVINNTDNIADLRIVLANPEGIINHDLPCGLEKGNLALNVSDMPNYTFNTYGNTSGNPYYLTRLNQSFEVKNSNFQPMAFQSSEFDITSCKP